MSTALFAYPAKAALGRVVPKNKIYAHGNSGANVRGLFVSQVDQIVWRFKLAPETIKLAARPSVPEIQIFEIALKGARLDENVLRAIDKAIPFPILFELTREGEVRTIATLQTAERGRSGQMGHWRLLRDGLAVGRHGTSAVAGRSQSERSL